MAAPASTTIAGKKYIKINSIRSMSLISIIKSALVAFVAVVVFCTSFTLSIVQTLIYQTIPESKQRLVKMWNENKFSLQSYAKSLYERLENYKVFRFTLWWLKLWLFLVRKTLQIGNDIINNVLATPLMVELRERLEDFKFDWRNGVAEFVYSLIAMVVVCNIVLVRFVFITIWNLRSLVFQGRSQPVSSDDGDVDNLTEDDFKQSAFEKMAEYSHKFSTPTSFKGISRKSVPARHHTEPFESSTKQRKSVIDVFSSANENK